MDLYTPKKDDKCYNRSLSFVQASYMGKSRLVDHSAKYRFTFPFNLHEPLPIGFNGARPPSRFVMCWCFLHSAYPPFDDNIREYLTTPFHDEVQALTRHFLFLQALFSSAVEELDSYSQDTAQNIALKWYEWMREGSTLTSVGHNRKAFYDRVIEAVRKAHRLFCCFHSPPEELPSSKQ